MFDSTVLAKYDALVLVHPGMQLIKGDYIFDIALAVGLMEGLGKPIFHLPHSHNFRTHFPDIYRRTIGLPASSQQPNPTNRQMERIAYATGKNPQDIEVAVGGMSAHVCVPIWAAQSSMQTDFPQGITSHLKTIRVKTPLKKANIILELTDLRR